MPTGVFTDSTKGRRIGVEHIDDEANVTAALQAGYTHVRVERSKDFGNTWEELTTPETRPVVEEGVTVYRVTDRLGSEVYEYRSSYTNGTNSTDPSLPASGLSLAVKGVITPQRLRDIFLFGLDLTDDAGVPLSDDVYETYIAAAIESIEHELDIPILPTTFQDETHDYHYQDYKQWCFLQLENYPVISIEKLATHLPSKASEVIWPNEWIHLDRDHGLIRVVPASGNLSQVALARGHYLPNINYYGMGHFPDLFHIDYVAGFEVIPRNLVEMIGKLASLGPFNIFGDLIAGAGIANLSLSIDGLSQTIGTTSSATNAGFGARIIQYQKDLKEKIPMLRRYFKGIRMQVI